MALTQAPHAVQSQFHHLVHVRRGQPVGGAINFPGTAVGAPETPVGLGLGLNKSPCLEIALLKPGMIIFSGDNSKPLYKSAA